MFALKGTCPHCGQEVTCGMLDHKLKATCSHCQQPLFQRVKLVLRFINVMFLVPIVVAMIGMAIRKSRGVWACFGMIGIAALLIFVILFLERSVCMRVLRSRKA